MSNVIYDRLVGDFLGQHKLYVLFYSLITLLTWPTEAIIVSRIYSKLIESLKKNAKMEQIFNFKDNIKKENIFGVLCIIIIVWFGLILFYRTKFSVEQKLLPLFLSHIRQTLVEGILNSNSENYSDIKTGEILAKINDITFSLRGLIERVAAKIMPLMLGLVTISLYYLWLNPILGIAFIALTIFQLIVYYVGGNEYSKRCATRDKTYFKLNEQISDTLNNSMNIHLNNAFDDETKKNDNMNKKHDIDQEREMIFRKNLVLRYNFITVMIFVIIIILSYSLYKKKKINLPLLMTVTFIQIKLIGTMIEFDSTSLEFFYRIGTIMATETFLKSVLKDTNKSRNCVSDNYDIEIKNMFYRYDNEGPYIFKNMNLNIKQGEKIGIIGRSGSGKSTLMKILLGLHKTTSGTIQIGKCNINNIPHEILREEIIYINQKTNLFNETVLNNIQYGNKGLTESEVKNYLKKYNLDIIYSGLSNGIQTNVGVNGSNLSLGMQKITMLLRGIFKKGNIMIFDEPLTGLDAKTKEKAIRMIDNIEKNKTVIVITHDDEILSHLNKVYDLATLQTNK